MRGIDHALLKSKSKCPLEQIQVLYLSNTQLDYISNLNGCIQLHTIYLQSNRLQNVSGLSSLKNLWHIDLSFNPRLHDITPLSEYVAFGYLSLENCSFTFEELAVLRDLHIVDFRGNGNVPLLRDGIEIYRMKCAALLPNIWTLDGLYITTDQRLLAMEKMNTFVYMVTQTDQYGASTNAWKFDRPINVHAEEMSSIVAHEPTHRLQRESYRLKSLVSLYDTLALNVNMSIHLAPKGFSPWVKIDLNSVLRLPSRARLNVAILLALRFDFPTIPLFLLEDAMTINLLGYLQVDEIRGLHAAPFYLVTALLYFLEEQSHGETITLPEHDRKLWASLPLVYSTFFPTTSSLIDDTAFSRRCCYAVILLSRAPSFPPLTNASTTASSVYQAIEPLLEKAKMTMRDLHPDTASYPIPWIGKTQHVDGISTGKVSDLPWNRERDHIYRPVEDESDGILNNNASEPVVESTNGIKPKWVGKLHRQAQGYHRDGIPRATDVPNEDLSTEEFEEATNGTNVNRTVEVFTTNTSWNANYVLAPSAIIQAQNYWMEKKMNQGGWSNIASASCVRVGAASFIAQPRPFGSTRRSVSMKTLPRREPVQVEESTSEDTIAVELPAELPEHGLSDIQLLQRDMALLLGKPISKDDSDTAFFITAMNNNESNKTQNTADTNQPHLTIQLNESTEHDTSNVLGVSTSKEKPLLRKGGQRSWHAVPGKSQLVVADTHPSMPSLSKPKKISSNSTLPLLSLTPSKAALFPRSSSLPIL